MENYVEKNFFVENSKIIVLLMWKSKILIWIKINKTVTFKAIDSFEII